MQHAMLDRLRHAGRISLAAALALSLPSCSSGSGEPVEWFACWESPSPGALQCRVGLDICWYDPEAHDACLEIPPDCSDADGGRDWSCLAARACPGLAWAPWRGGLECFPAGTYPCPLVYSGVLTDYTGCAIADEICVESCGGGDCSSQGCVPVPAECSATPTCTCIGPAFCHGDPYECTERTELTYPMVTCNPL
jgi:hypothetical protein